MKTNKPESFYKSLAEKIGAEKRNNIKKNFNLGYAIRQMRISREIKGADLCRKAGDLDPRTLNAIEKGRIKNPSLRTLQSVAGGLGVLVSDIFRQEEMAKDCYFYQGTQKGAYEVAFPSLGIKAVGFTPFIKDFFFGKLIVGARREFKETLLNHPHPIFVSALMGRFEAEIEERKIELREGENIFFKGSLRHSFFNPLRKDSVLLMMTAPSFFK